MHVMMVLSNRNRDSIEHRFAVTATVADPLSRTRPSYEPIFRYNLFGIRTPFIFIYYDLLYFYDGFVYALTRFSSFFDVRYSRSGSISYMGVVYE
jgi:hypothetical protein